MIRFTLKWTAFVLAWAGYGIQQTGAGLILVAKRMYPEWL